nr:E4 protein [Lemur mastadenovirus]
MSAAASSSISTLMWLSLRVPKPLMRFYGRRGLDPCRLLWQGMLEWNSSRDPLNPPCLSINCACCGSYVLALRGPWSRVRETIFYLSCWLRYILGRAVLGEDLTYAPEVERLQVHCVALQTFHQHHHHWPFVPCQTRYLSQDERSGSSQEL